MQEEKEKIVSRSQYSQEMIDHLTELMSEGKGLFEFFHDEFSELDEIQKAYIFSIFNINFFKSMGQEHAVSPITKELRELESLIVNKMNGTL